MSKILIPAVAQTIRDLRKQKRLSQEDLAELSNLDRTYISGIERGVRNITLDSLEAIIIALSLSPSAFLNALRANIVEKENN
jgi:transcriptional regulator with XRE-family HTH domain